MSDAKTTIGQYTGTLYTAQHTADVGWRYVDEQGYGYPAYDLRCATAEDALAKAVELDLARAAVADWSELTREAYEAECARLGVEALSDRDIDSYAIHYLEVSPLLDGARAYARYALARRRLKPIVAEKEAQRTSRLAALEARARAMPPRPWAQGGVRYDEACDQCHRISEVDNDTGLCQRCYGAPRSRGW